MAKRVPERAKNEYRRLVRRHLKTLTSQLQQKLERILNGKLPAGVERVSFEVFSDGFYEEFPVYAYAVNAAEGEVYFRQPFSGYVLPKVKRVLPRAHESVEEKFEDKGVNCWSAATAELIEWFSEQWTAVGGRKFSADAVIQHHDDIEYFDLRDRKWKWWIKPLKTAK